MTPATILEGEIAAESALSIVARQTCHPARGNEMFGGRG